MSCRSNRVYVVVSEDRKKVVAYGGDENLVWQDQLPWTKTKKFKSVRSARLCATDFGGQVMSWIGFKREHKRME